MESSPKSKLENTLYVTALALFGICIPSSCSLGFQIFPNVYWFLKVTFAGAALIIALLFFILIAAIMNLICEPILKGEPSFDDRLFIVGAFLLLFVGLFQTIFFPSYDFMVLGVGKVLLMFVIFFPLAYYIPYKRVVQSVFDWLMGAGGRFSK